MKKQEYIIDCRGLACPAPVLRAKETIEREAVDFLVMLVDNEAARENVSRFLSRAGYAVRLEEWEGAQAVVGERSGAAGEAPAGPAAAAVKAAAENHGVGGIEPAGHAAMIF